MSRNISTLQYFNVLQMEYILYEIRSKIYPYNKDREKFKGVMEFKKKKIFDISIKNSLKNIFSDSLLLSEFYDEFMFLFLKDEIGTKKDKYFYYFLESDFSYKGQICKIKRYDLEKQVADIEILGNIESVNFSDIRRIL